MESLEWRTKKLEDKILSSTPNHLNSDSILNLLLPVAELYANSSKDNYSRFMELQDVSRTILNDNSESTKIDLVLAYKDDLLNYMNDLEVMCNKADKVLDPNRWPDSCKYKEKLEKLTEVTSSQFKESTKLDGKVEELIGIYNDIINSFRSNMKRWDELLESHEKLADEEPAKSACL